MSEPRLTSQELIARVQALIDAPRPEGGHPLRWHVEASRLGDLTAIVAAVLHSASSATPPPPTPR